MTICASRADGDEAFDARAGLPIVRIPRDAFRSYWNGRRRRALNLAKLSRLCHQGKTEVVIASRAMPDGLVAWTLNEVWGIPYVVYTWALDILRQARGEWGRRYVTRVLRGAAHVVGCSEFTCSAARELGVEASKVTKIYPGVDHSAFRPAVPGEILALKQRFGLQERRIILTVGRLVTRKGHDQVIGALGSVVERVPDAVYVVVGDGPDREVLERLVRERGLENHVVFAGSRSPDEVAPYYQIADLFIMPSRNIEGDAEGFGIVFIEAGACHVPVIGGASGGVADAVAHGDTGLLVDPMSADDIAHAMITLLEDEDLAKSMGKAGRARAEREFSWVRAAERIQAITESVNPTKPFPQRAFDPRAMVRAASTVIRRD
jgi:phosphatidylinositol alpha-1,6-mannosyltransferase